MGLVMVMTHCRSAPRAMQDCVLHCLAQLSDLAQPRNAADMLKHPMQARLKS